MSRVRGTYFSHNRMRVMHADFIKKAQLNRRKVATPKVYRDIIKRIFFKVFREIVLEGYEFSLTGLGKFMCVKYLPKIKITEDGRVITNKPVDFPATYKARKETGNNKLFVYFDNRETGGYTFKVLWDTAHTNFKNKTFYVLKLEKDLKKWFNKQIITGDVPARIINVNL